MDFRIFLVFLFLIIFWGFRVFLASRFLFFVLDFRIYLVSLFLMIFMNFRILLGPLALKFSLYFSIVLVLPLDDLFVLQDFPGAFPFDTGRSGLVRQCPMKSLRFICPSIRPSLSFLKIGS